MREGKIMTPQILNIIHFMRGPNERHPSVRYVMNAVKKQVEIIKKYKFEATFLFQYDTLTNSSFKNYFHKESSDLLEYGAWLEIPQPLVEVVGLKWRGREGYNWDWHTNVGFLQGYTQEERRLLIDGYMVKFKEVFGYYPKSVGAWLLDAWSMKYMSEAYNINAFCICRDQWGTDGYTLWGGLPTAYYPCKKNALSPAQTDDEQISTPVFRMLGSDPIYQYDAGQNTDTYAPAAWQSVRTLEPANKECGGNKHWISWFMNENFGSLSYPFGYAHAGQENSFSWQKTKYGWEKQCSAFAEYRDNGKIEVQKLCDTGKWFQKQFSKTPVQISGAVSDYKQRDIQSVWYGSNKYRINLYRKDGVFRIRDWMFYDEKYEERYLSKTCVTSNGIYDALPIMDGAHDSGNGILAGVYPVECSGNNEYKHVVCESTPDFQRFENNLECSFITSSKAHWQINCEENKVSVTIPSNGALSFEWGTVPAEKPVVQDNKIKYCHEGTNYVLKANGCKFISNNENNIICLPLQETITLTLETLD